MVGITEVPCHKPVEFSPILYREHLYKVLSKHGPFSDEDWVPGLETINALETSKILLASCTRP